MTNAGRPHYFDFVPLEEALNRAYVRSVEMLFGEAEAGRTVSTHAVMRGIEEPHIQRGARLVYLMVEMGREVMPNLLVLSSFGRWKLWCWGKEVVDRAVLTLGESLTGGVGSAEMEAVVEKLQWEGLQLRDTLIRGGHCRGRQLGAELREAREGRVSETPERRRLRSDEVESVEDSEDGEGTAANPISCVTPPGGEVQVYDSQREG